MPSYDGIVNLDQNQVEVRIGLDPDRVHLAAEGMEIGDWTAEECSIAELEEGVYSINAENVSLRFVPDDPRLFLEGLNHGTGYGLSPGPEPTADVGHRGRHTRSMETEAQPGLDPRIAPPPRALTRILFYVLSAVTAGLGAWALISIL